MKLLRPYDLLNHLFRIEYTISNTYPSHFGTRVEANKQDIRIYFTAWELHQHNLNYEISSHIHF